MKDLRKQRYYTHKRNTINRVDTNGNPIEFKLTFVEWWDIWEASGKYHLYGNRKGQYCMSRVNDIGHYEVGNVFIQLTTENTIQGNIGKTKTAETKAKISATLTGRTRSEESKQKQSAATKGRTQSAEHKQKRSAALKGRSMSEEQKQKLRGRTRSEESKQKMSEAFKGRIPWNKGKKGRPRSPEVIAKAIATRKANREKRKQEIQI